VTVINRKRNTPNQTVRKLFLHLIPIRNNSFMTSSRLQPLTRKF